MGIFIAAILAIILIVGMIILFRANKKNRVNIKPQEGITEVDASCCGAHEICEFDAAKVNTELIEYFNDEELDKYQNKDANEYSDEVIDEFREVLYTLQPKEIQLWMLSISRRNINLPSILNEEAILLMAEQ